MRKSIEEKTLEVHEEKLRGKHVMVIGSKIFAATTGEEAARKFRELRKKYPNKTPLIAYIPKADSLILWL